MPDPAVRSPTRRGAPVRCLLLARAPGSPTAVPPFPWSTRRSRSSMRRLHRHLRRPVARLPPSLSRGRRSSAILNPTRYKRVVPGTLAGGPTTPPSTNLANGVAIVRCCRCDGVDINVDTREPGVRNGLRHIGRRRRRTHRHDDVGVLHESLERLDVDQSRRLGPCASSGGSPGAAPQPFTTAGRGQRRAHRSRMQEAGGHASAGDVAHGGRPRRVGVAFPVPVA